MPRRATRLPINDDPERPVVITTRIPAWLYNQLVAESEKRERKTIGPELERHIRRCLDLEEIFGRGELNQAHSLARDLAHAIKLSADTEDDAPLGTAMVNTVRRLWHMHRVRTHQGGDDLKNRINQVIELQLAYDQVKSEDAQQGDPA